MKVARALRVLIPLGLLMVASFAASTTVRLPSDDVTWSFE